ncbi:MAG: cation transporter [Marinilabiliaceae bacterium]|nr:cation transporter [Marinilabiliaceae bacterium]
MNPDNNNSKFENKTKIVVIITAITMVVEIVFGITTHSMALLADGIHMGSHVLAIGLSWLAYVMIRKVEKSQKYDAKESKILSLSGYTSGIILLIFSFAIIVEAIERFSNPLNIKFFEAIFVAIIGLIINIISAFILHHNHDQSDHNIKAAYLHVLADTLTSLSAIFGLLISKYFNVLYLDSVAALISSIVILKWSVGLIIQSANVLIDFKSLMPNKKTNT